MQKTAQARLDPKHSQELWQSMLSTISDMKLDGPALPRILCKLPIFCTLSAAALYAAWTTNGTLTLLASCLVLAFLLAQFAFLGHDAGHRSLGLSQNAHRALGQLSMTIMTGLAFDEWYARHRTHHQFCQFEAKDPDMDVDLVVSLTENSRRRKNALGLILTRWQGLSVWFLSILFAQSQRHLSQWGVLRDLRIYRVDALFLSLHILLWWILPLLSGVDPFRVLLVYTLPLFFLGPYLATIFWVNHVGMPLIDKLEHFSFLEHQAVTSRTVLNPPQLDWFFGGLNFQIEHHLYPQIPSFRLRRVQSIVRPTFERDGIPYHAVSLSQAFREIGGHFRAIARSQDMTL